MTVKRCSWFVDGKLMDFCSYGENVDVCTSVLVNLEHYKGAFSALKSLTYLYMTFPLVYIDCWESVRTNLRPVWSFVLWLRHRFKQGLAGGRRNQKASAVLQCIDPRTAVKIMKRTEQCVSLGHAGESQRLPVPDETGYTLRNANAYGVFMASSITVAVMHPLCMLVWKDWNFLLARKRKCHCCRLQAANTSACWFSRFCAWHGLENLRLQTSASCFICPGFFLLFVSVKTLTVFLTTTETTLKAPLKRKRSKLIFLSPAQIGHSWVDKDVVSLSSQPFFSVPSVMVEVAKRVLAAALHSNRC